MQYGRPGFDPWVRKITWRRKWQPIPELLPGKFHGWKSMVGYSPHDHKESDMTEQFHTHTKRECQLDRKNMSKIYQIIKWYEVPVEIGRKGRYRV